MDYKPAQLDNTALAQLQQFEHELRKQTSEDIIVVAYKVSGETAHGMQAALNRE